MEPNKTLYLFDFDGTITNNDTYIDFFTKSFGTSYVLKRVLSNGLKTLWLYLQRDKSKLKEFLTFVLLKDQNLNELEKVSQQYFKNHHSRILYKSAVQKIQAIQQDKNSDIYIVSASLDLWLKEFASYFNANLICTELKFESNKYVGFHTKNCNGLEKSIRIQKEINLKEYNQIIAYGNSNGDREMYTLSDQYFHKFFTN